jgi:hypothetical protein
MEATPERDEILDSSETLRGVMKGYRKLLKKAIGSWC